MGQEIRAVQTQEAELRLGKLVTGAREETEPLSRDPETLAWERWAWGKQPPETSIRPAEVRVA